MNILRRTFTERRYPTRWARTATLLGGLLIVAGAVGEMLLDDTWSMDSVWISNLLMGAAFLTFLLAEVLHEKTPWVVRALRVSGMVSLVASVSLLLLSGRLPVETFLMIVWVFLVFLLILYVVVKANREDGV